MVAKADINAVTKNQGGFQSPIPCNSTITPLGSGAQFLGKLEKNGFPHVMVSIETDQDGTLFLEFSDNGGDHWVTEPLGGIDVVAGVHKQHVMIKGPRSFRVRYINGTGGAQTIFRLYTYYGFFTEPVETVVPLENPLTIFGDLRIAELSPVFQNSFEYTVDNTELTTNVVTNGGVVTQADAMAVISSSTTTDSTACLTSRRHARYKAGLGSLTRFTALFERNVANTEQYVGLLDEVGSSAAFKNGLAIGYDGTTFGFHRFSGDVKESINQSDWDDPLDGTGRSGMTLDHTKLNVWAIGFQYLGAGAITLFLETDERNIFMAVHTIQYTNRNIVPSSQNPNYRFTIFADNSGTTADLVIKSSSFAYFVEGKTDIKPIHQPQFATGQRTKAGVTAEVAIFTIRNKAAYVGKTNFIDAILELITCSIESSAANNLSNFRIVRDAALGGVPAFTDINTANSVMEIDVAGTTLTGGTEIAAFPLAGKNDKIAFNLTDFQIILQAGETITVSATSSNSATVTAGGLWKELF